VFRKYTIQILAAPTINMNEVLGDSPQHIRNQDNVTYVFKYVDMKMGFLIFLRKLTGSLLWYYSWQLYWCKAKNWGFEIYAEQCSVLPAYRGEGLPAPQYFQILCFWTLSIILFFYLKTLSCLYFKTQLFRDRFQSLKFWNINRMLFLDKNRTMDNVQNRNICTNVPSSQTFISYL
jgi:hypothetical protein